MTSKLSTLSCGSASRLDEAIEVVAREANYAALDEHRRMGRSVPIMRDGQIVWLGPDEIAQVLEARGTQGKDNK